MLECGHDRPPFGAPICEHLRTCRKPWLSYVKWLLGKGLNSDLLCVPCANQRGEGMPVAVASVCQECFSYATTEVGDLAGVRGTAGILERPEALHAHLSRTALPSGFGNAIDFAPINGLNSSTWILLVEDGRLLRFDADRRECVVVASSAVPPELEREPWAGRVLKRRLHVSSSGDFAAVVNDYGSHGQLLDLRSGRVSLVLDGGDYHPETVPFSFAFVDVKGRELAVHRTDWNRLDISDASTGELVTKRGPTSYSRGEERPPHYLDYFHGRLHVNPSSSHLLDDGWVWHPMGIPTTWSLHRWALENPWESEDGPTKLDACARDSYWDHGVAWLNETMVAVGGVGDDDNAMVDGARVFDISATATPGAKWRSDWRVAREVVDFAGPSGVFFAAENRLFSSDSSGLSRWDVETGARTGRLSNFQPTRHHRGAGELAQIVDGGLVRWRCSAPKAP
jgi:hypothetical protein